MNGFSNQPPSISGVVPITSVQLRPVLIPTIIVGCCADVSHASRIESVGNPGITRGKGNDHQDYSVPGTYLLPHDLRRLADLVAMHDADQIIVATHATCGTVSQFSLRINNEEPEFLSESVEAFAKDVVTASRDAGIPARVARAEAQSWDDVEIAAALSKVIAHNIAVHMMERSQALIDGAESKKDPAHELKKARDLRDLKISAYFSPHHNGRLKPSVEFQSVGTLAPHPPVLFKSQLRDLSQHR